MYVYINCLNISLIDGESVGTRAKARVGLKSRPRKSKIVKFGPLEASLPCAIARLRVKSLSGLLEVAKSYGQFF